MEGIGNIIYLLHFILMACEVMSQTMTQKP